MIPTVKGPPFGASLASTECYWKPLGIHAFPVAGPDAEQYAPKAPRSVGREYYGYRETFKNTLATVTFQCSRSVGDLSSLYEQQHKSKTRQHIMQEAWWNSCENHWKT